MSQAGLLNKIITRLTTEINSRGLTAYFLHDDEAANTQLINTQQLIADGLRANGVTVGDITDADTQTFDDRGLLIVFSGKRWMDRKNVTTKLRTAIQIRWIVCIHKTMRRLENFDKVLETVVNDEGFTTNVQIWKRILVYV